ncbi:hypothetical protein A2U01_0114024, partial [Trifolium medium]|nr:hypothetical protein [Trifolium medium]
AVSWITPPPDTLKCNIDVAIFSLEQNVSMGACLRNEF